MTAKDTESLRAVLCYNGQPHDWLYHHDAGTSRCAKCGRRDAPVVQVKHAEAALATALERLEAAERDARRYRFLRGEDDFPRDSPAYLPEEEGWWGGKELDEGIDAALAARE